MKAKYYFSSLGCQEMNHLQMAKLAKACGADGVELRGKSADAHISPDTPTDRQQEILKIYKDHGLGICGITSYVSFSQTDIEEENVREVARYAELCANMQAQYVRVYLGETDPQPDRTLVAQALKKACSAAKKYPVKILLEMHDALKNGAMAKELIEKAGSPENLGVIFDTVLPFRQNEKPQDAWDGICDRVGALHVRAVGLDESGKSRHVLPEESIYPLDALLGVIAKSSFDGPWVLLWERIFDPSLAPMEEAIAAYRQAIERAFAGR